MKLYHPFAATLYQQYTATMYHPQGSAKKKKAATQRAKTKRSPFRTCGQSKSNRFDLRERFPEAGPLSRAVQECEEKRCSPALERVAVGKIMARKKRFDKSVEFLLWEQHHEV